MKILVACEFSGVVRDAFIKRGHEAVSCDLLPSERPGPHIVGNVLDHLHEDWDMMIAFPPCTHLAVSGARWFKDKQEEQHEAMDFFLQLACYPPKLSMGGKTGFIECLLDPIVEGSDPGHFRGLLMLWQINGDKNSSRPEKTSPDLGSKGMGKAQGPERGDHSGDKKET